MPNGNVRSFPRHPFPLLSGECPLDDNRIGGCPLVLTKAEKKVLDIMHGGGRILLDINAKRGLVYTFARGAVILGEVTVRAIARLVKRGVLAICGRMGGVVHYALPGQAQHMNWWLQEANEQGLQIS